MRVAALIFLITASASASAVAQATLEGQYDCAPAGAYTLCQNLWGESAGVGSQTTTLLSAKNHSVSWRTVWDWQNGPNNIKSYANVEHKSAKGVQLASLKSVPTAWQWQYEDHRSTKPGHIRADISYDIWTGWSAIGAPASSASSYEIMIWLSNKGGIQPVGSQVQSDITLAGHTWTLWQGPNANWEVLTFVSADGDITNFNADLKEFFDFIQQNYGVSEWQYVHAIQSGTEPFTGSASLLTNDFRVAVQHYY